MELSILLDASRRLKLKKKLSFIFSKKQESQFFIFTAQVGEINAVFMRHLYIASANKTNATFQQHIGGF